VEPRLPPADEYVSKWKPVYEPRIADGAKEGKRRHKSATLMTIEDIELRQAVCEDKKKAKASARKARSKPKSSSKKPAKRKGAKRKGPFQSAEKTQGPRQR